MSNKKTLLILSGILVGTLVLITAFAFLASQPAKPVNVEVGDAYFFGPKDAKVTVVEFSDFQCPVCQRFATEVLPQLEKEYQDKVKFVFKFFPLYETHKLANLSAQSAWCSGQSSFAKATEDKNKFWEYSDLLMKNSSDWENNQDKLNDYAKQLGLDVNAFQACQNSEGAKNVVLADRQQGERLGINATPTFFVNGEKLVGYQPFDYWKNLLDSKLK